MLITEFAIFSDYEASMLQPQASNAPATHNHNYQDSISNI